MRVQISLFTVKFKLRRTRVSYFIGTRKFNVFVLGKTIHLNTGFTHIINHVYGGDYRHRSIDLYTLDVYRYYNYKYYSLWISCLSVCSSYPTIFFSYLSGVRTDVELFRTTTVKTPSNMKTTLILVR